MMRYMAATLCPVCKGPRLRPEALAVTLPIPIQPSNLTPNKNSVILSEARSAQSKDPEEARITTAAKNLSTQNPHGFSIADFTALPLERALEAAKSMNFTGRDRIIADRLQREIIERLQFLNAVGLVYLALDHSAATLSSEECQ